MVDKGLGDRVVIYMAVEMLIYCQFFECVNQIVNLLVDDLGVVLGNCVLLYGFNGIVLFVVWYVVFKVGVVVVIIMLMLCVGELVKIVNKVEVNFVLCDNKLCYVVEKVCEMMGKFFCIVDWVGDGLFEIFVVFKFIVFDNVDIVCDDVVLLVCILGIIGEFKVCVYFYFVILVMVDMFVSYCF